MTLLGPLGPEMAQISGRRKDGYPEPGHTFRRPGSNFRRRNPSQQRPRRRKNNENRRNRPSNKKQTEDSKGTSTVRQEAEPVVKTESTPAVTSAEWAVPDLSDTLFNHCKSVYDKYLCPSIFCFSSILLLCHSIANSVFSMHLLKYQDLSF